MSSIADSIINGTYGNNSSKKGSVADMIIDGSYSERVRKQREEEEEKRRAERERQKKINEAKTTTNVLPKANSNFSNLEDLQKEYNKLSLTEQAEMAKKIDNKSSLEKLAESSNKINQPIYSGETLKEKYGEFTKVTHADIEASKRADEINKAIENKDYGTAIGFVVEGLGEGVKSGFAAIADSGLTLEAYNMEHGEKNVGKLIDAYERMLDNKGILNSEKGQKTLANLEKVKGFFGNSKDKLLDNAEYLNESTGKYQKTLSKVDNNIVKTGGQVTNIVGEMIPAMASNFVVPGSGAIVTGVQTAGKSAIENLDNERSNLGKSIVTGTAKGVVAAKINAITGGDFISDGFVDKWATKGISKITANKVAQNVLWKSYQVLGEQAEELLEDDIGNIIDKVINGKEFPTIQDKFSQAGETAKVTALTTLVLNSIGLGGGSFSDAVTRTQQTSNPTINNQNTQSLQEQNTEPLANIIEQNNIDTNIENTQGQINSELNEILNNKELPMQGYKYESSNNAKINNLRQQAGKYFNNSQEAHKFVDMLEKIIVDKDIEIRLDANLKTADGRIANGSYSNGVITINPNSSRTGEFIAIHELTHAIGTKSMINIVENYRKNNAEFNSAVESLLQNYNATELTEEALSDVSAQLFGNQEFINNVANTNPGFFKKFYNEIKYLWHQFRGYKNQNQFIEDLYYKWTQAYNSNNKLNGTNNYSIAGINAVNNIKNNRELYDQAINNYNLAKEMVEKGKNNAEIIEKTGWFKDKNGHWKFEFSDKHMTLKNMQYEVGKTYKLGKILNHNELFMFYPKLANHKVEFVEEKNSKKKAKYDSESETISINSQLLNKKNAQELIEGTLIHEIQHAIQHIEGFEEGASSFSKLAYYNSLGEIEADNTKTRFIDEKYKNKNISNIAPESSKDNPKHRGLDNYLQNQTMLDKIKDGIYNYIKSNKGEYDYEINQEITLQDKEENNSKMDVGRRINGQENSNKSSFSMDNKGRTLTKEQQEFFKDSKIKDRNGLLMTVYHGTNNDFNIFDKQYVSENTKNAGFYGDGFYFTPDKESARQYGKNSKEVYLNIENPFSFADLSKYNGEDYYSDYVQIANLVDLNHEWGNIPVRFNDKNTWGDIYKDVKSMLENNKSDEEIDNLMYDKYGEISEKINDRLYNYSKRNKYKTLSQVLEENGYDGIINRETPENSTEIVVFNSNQIKSIDNTNPTSNPDIRYSISEDTEGRVLSKEQQDFFKDSIVRDEDGNLKIMYHGTDAEFNEFTYENYGKTGTAYGKGFYFTDSKEAGQAYGKNLKEVYLDIKKPMEIGKTTMSKAEFKKLVEAVNKETGGTIEADYGSIEDAVMEYDYGGDDIDLTNGLMSVSGLKTEKFYEILRNTLGYDGIKANNNSNGKDGNYYLAFNSNQIKNIDNINPTGNPDIRHSQNNESWQQHLDKNFKATGTRTNMKDIGINVAPTAKNNVAPSVENNVASVAENSKQNNDLKKKYTRKEVRNRLFNEMQISPEDLNIGDDIKSPNYQITDPVRVNEKVFGKELGDKINNATINKTKHNTAEKIRWQNKERQEIKDLGIKARSKESSAVQKYGEKQWVTEDGQILKYGDIELAKEFPDIDTQNKIKKAAQVIREKYDSYIEQINEVLTELGYDAIPKRTDYMRHFHELGDIFSKTGVPFNLNDMSVEDLPTDINGLTEFNKPGKNWFASSQKRYGNKTTYDAITGIDGYLEGAGNLIFHTEDIQNYRALSEAIRNQFGQTKGFDNLEGLTDEQKQQRIKDIQNNKLSKYVAWLDEQANSLAGKKGSIDRGFERVLGRKGYTLLNTVKKQVGSNMTGFNVRSSLTNFISSTIAAAKTNKIALAKGTVSTINNMFHNDGFVEKSDFLTSRFGSDSLSAKTWQKISNAGQIFMTGSDYFTSNLIARSKYFEGLQKGMSEQEALNYSNDFSSKVMGDRSQGAMPEAFNSKTLGLFTQFQLEVNNQWQHMIHDTKMDYQQNVKDKGGLKAGATVLFQMGQLAAYSYFFNELFENLTGSRAAFDPIEIFKTLFGLDDEDEEKTFDQRIAEAGEMLADNIPFGNLITGGGRIPISDAFEGIGTLGKKITNQKNQYGGEITWGDVGKDMLNSLPYWVSPTGYSQANKTVQGLSTVINNGDYKTNSKGEKELRFPVENKNAGTYIKAGLFGKYSLPTAQDYIKRDFKKLSANQTKTYEESGLTYKQYINYADADLKNKEEKIDYINKQEWTYKQKWNIYKNDILSSTKRKDGSSQLSDAEYIVSHGVSKTKFMELYNKAYKNGIDMPTQQEYKELQKKGITLERYIYDKIYKR